MITYRPRHAEVVFAARWLGDEGVHSTFATLLIRMAVNGHSIGLSLTSTNGMQVMLPTDSLSVTVPVGGWLVFCEDPLARRPLIEAFEDSEFADQFESAPALDDPPPALAPAKRRPGRPRKKR